MAASSGAIPNWLALFLRVQEWADFLDANAAEATPHPWPWSWPAYRNRRTNPHPARSWRWSDALSLPHVLTHAGSENCRSIRCVHTPRTGGDETTNRSVTPGNPHNHCHSASKRGWFRGDLFSFDFSFMSSVRKMMSTAKNASRAFSASSEVFSEHPAP
jgi:hypothetical protein